jgi:uracil-DNA glycosylase
MFSSLSDPQRAAAELLQWYVDMGVDVSVDEDPHDRLGEARAVPTPPARTEARPAAFAGAAADASDVAAEARLMARSAQSLEELRALLEKFEGCALRTTAKSLVFSDGNPEARLMFVGEAPGAEEDRMGVPLVGGAGQLLDRMLAAIGLDRTGAYITSVIPWRPPGNRPPTPQEAAVCQPFLVRQIELADPDVLVCLGGASALALLGIKDAIMRSRGRWSEYDTGTRRIRAMATLHPAYLLRQPLQKRLAWRDFKAIRDALRET